MSSQVVLKTKSQTRSSTRRDSGFTRANMTGMKCCCIFFARGYCPYGWECEYLHTLPDVSMTLPKTLKDCFARDKFADYRDDMGGVGSCMNHAWLGYVRVVEAPVRGRKTVTLTMSTRRNWH
ncbi:hypothetical protein BDQ17DRAFT_531684 [Cyathus striatus]|nr:hypothetical protein BDQ17DRAFT_531684 [Cyathus striatus]